MSIERLDELHARLDSELLACSPEGGFGVSLSVRLGSKQGRGRFAAALCAAGGAKLRPSPRLASALRDVIRQCREEGRMFEAANFVVYPDREHWLVQSAFGYSPSASKRPLVVGAVWPATLSELLEQHVVAAYCKQHRIVQLVGASRWKVDFDTARIWFSIPAREFDVAFLGSVGRSSGTWLHPTDSEGLRRWPKKLSGFSVSAVTRAGAGPTFGLPRRSRRVAADGQVAHAQAGRLDHDDGARRQVRLGACERV
jgi:hypothetical protein